MSDKKNIYQELNKSYKHTLTYTFEKSGFYSTFNNMILTMALCLKYKIRFRIYSKSYAYFQGIGWNRFFEPIIPETNNPFFKRFNLRTNLVCESNFRGRVNLWMHHLYQLITNNNLVDSAFYESRTFWFSKEHFTIEEMGIDGDLRNLCHELTKITYRFNKTYQEKISNLEATLQLPHDYIGFHIRLGDKKKEREPIPIENYIRMAESLSPIRNAFVFTDDYSAIELIEDKFRNWNIYTLTKQTDRGYDFNATYNSESDSNMVKMFTSMDLLSKSQLFIGTVSANPGMFLGMFMDRDRVYYIDSQDWIIL